MTELFLNVLNMNLTAGYVIIFVILIRLLLKKAPKVISYVLWAVVAFRLVIPFSFESIFSLLPQTAVPITHDIIYHQKPQINSGILPVDSIVNEVLPSPTIGNSVNPMQIYIEVGAYIWMIGIIALIVYSFISVFRLKKQLKNAQLIEQDIYQAENLHTPFVLGLINPKIYLPAGLDKEEYQYILLHEQTHIYRKDHIIKIIAFIILTIHWFNPLVWVTFMLMSMDMELSCDERVLKEMNVDIKKSYANSLLTLSTERRILNGSPLAFGEGNVKWRIKNVLNYKKPKFWMVAISIIVVIAAGICLIANPKTVTHNNAADNFSLESPDMVTTEEGYENTNYDKISAYLKEECINVFSPYYELLDFIISDYREEVVNGNIEAVFNYKMIDKNYDRDPDTVEYIKEAKERGDKNYQQLYDEYLKPKENNFYFKAIIDKNGEITLYTKNPAINSDEWKEVEMSNYIIKSPEEISEISEHLKKNRNELIENDIAEYITYNYEDRSMYIAGLKIFNEFGTKEFGYINEGGVNINSDENALSFSITYFTGPMLAAGTISGPEVHFKMNLDTNEIVEKELKPAPNYAEAAELYPEYINPDSIQYSNKVTELSDERMVEIGLYFKDYILKIEENILISKRTDSCKIQNSV